MHLGDSAGFPRQSWLFRESRLLPFLSIVALIGWPLVVLILFALLPSRQAAASAVVGAWLFLPPISLVIAGLPDYSKNTAATVGLVLATLIFCPDRFLAFRPRWFDLPMVLFCLTGIVTSLQNGLGLYDGLSDALNQTTVWGMPYFFGRLYFNDLDSLRQLTTTIVIGGLSYVPLCHFEMRMMTSIMMRIYGVGSWASGTGLRMGGYRPNVFFNTGLECGLWMTAASLTGWWLWRCGALKRIGQFPFGPLILPILIVTTILCRSTGAILLLVGGMFTLWFSNRLQTRLLLAALLLVGPVYAGLRITQLWSGQQVVDLVNTYLGPERSGSLSYRFAAEKQLIAKAIQQPFFGWGAWNRSDASFEDGRHVNTDGMWVIFLGQKGLVGLTLVYLAMTLPALRFVWRFPAPLWADPRVAAASVATTLLGLYVIDCLMNGFVNIVYLTLAGALVGIEPKQLRLQSSGSAIGTARMTAVMANADRDHNLGRALKAEGRLEEALATWRQALATLSKLRATQPDSFELQQQWCNYANDLAWLLASTPDPANRNVDESVTLAVKATEECPDCATYWNTLGAAQYRSGNLQAAVSAFDRAVALDHGGTPFDHIFLAMVNARLGNHDEARSWFVLAKTGMERAWSGHLELRHLFDEAEVILANAGVVSPNAEVS